MVSTANNSVLYTGSLLSILTTITKRVTVGGDRWVCDNHFTV